MALVNFLINFFAVIGLLILISYLISYIIEMYKDRTRRAANAKVNPPPNYMQNSGLRCPDYLSNTGVTKSALTCSNRDFGINVLDPSTCYSDTDAKTVKFPPLEDGKTWELYDTDGKKAMTDKEKWDFVRKNISGNPSRCDWVDKCGPVEGVKAVWQGVNKWCNATDPAQTTV